MKNFGDGQNGAKLGLRASAAIGSISLIVVLTLIPSISMAQTCIQKCGQELAVCQSGPDPGACDHAYDACLAGCIAFAADILG